MVTKTHRNPTRTLLIRAHIVKISGYDLTCDGHLVHQLDDDPAGEELAREVEQVAVVEHDQELGQLPLVGLHGPGLALAGVHPAEVCVHVNVHLMSGALRTVTLVWAGEEGGAVS